jgi:hypothetical protein
MLDKTSRNRRKESVATVMTLFVAFLKERRSCWTLRSLPDRGVLAGAPWGLDIRVWRAQRKCM